MEKRSINNNLCYCYCENFGYSTWVQSDESGLWFNLNDIFKMFPLSKNDKRDIKKSLTLNETEIYITFNRNDDNEEYNEAFISESVVHHVISLSKKETFRAENFIYEIIIDYDTTCTNLHQQKLNTGQRIALHALKHEAEHHKEVTEHYMKMLRNNTKIPEKFEEYKNEVDKEFEENKDFKPSYDNELVPHEKRLHDKINFNKEQQDAKPKVKLITDFDTVKDLGDCLDDYMNSIYNTINIFDELDQKDLCDDDILELNWDDLL